MKDADKFKLVCRSRDKAYSASKYLADGDFDSFGDMLHSSWIDKKEVVKDITSNYFDMIYLKARENGALGGKLMGAGGGGFFVFYVPKDKREKVIKSITTDTECRIYDFAFYDHGSRINCEC